MFFFKNNIGFPSFPKKVKTTEDADQKAWDFVECICSTEWAAGSVSLADASPPYCPPLKGMTKGEMAVVGYSCKQDKNTQRRIPKAFKLQCMVEDLPYSPLSGISPGSISSQMSIFNYWSLLPLLFLVF